MKNPIKIGQRYKDQDGAVGTVKKIEIDDKEPGRMDRITLDVVLNGEFVHTTTRRAYVVQMERLLSRICPRCESDMIRVDSNREMEMSEIRCIDCDLGFQAPVTEECIKKMWGCIRKEDAADDGYEESV